MSGTTTIDAKRMIALVGLALAALAVVASLLVALARPAHAATIFTVNSTGDQNDIGLDGVCDVSTTSGNQCTLRAALQEANANSNAPTVDVINFNIPGSGVHTINPGSSLGIGDPVIIDGYSQPGTRPNNLGTTSGKANIIAFNNPAGVSVSGNGIGNRVLSNSIFSNAGMAIDLGRDGVTANDSGDGDFGENNLQNFPVISSAKTGRKGTSIAGKLNSIPNKSFTLQFFASPELASSATAQGKTLIGEKGVSTDGSGNGSFTFKPAQKVPVGQFISATVTDQSGNTSEFSAAKKVVRKR